ncbi:MAG: HEAT repeat domain-containing protein [Cyanobacteria bacterium J06639_1]
MSEDTFAFHAAADSVTPDAVPTAAPDRDLMLRQLRDRDPATRMRAARAFCDIEDPRSIDALVDLLQDACPLARVSAAYALGRNTAPQVVDPLVRALDRDWNGYVRKGSVWALGNARDRRALPAVCQALRHDISAVRLWAASALGQIGGEEAIAPLIEGLQQDPVAAIRGNCAWALGQVLPELSVAHSEPSSAGDRGKARTALIAALHEDADDGVRDDARAALEKWGEPVGLAAIAAWEDEQY